MKKKKSPSHPETYTNETIAFDYENRPKKRVRRTKEEIKPHYVDAVVMEQLIAQYYLDGNMTDELADMIQKIATRLGYAQNFLNYSFKEEMIGDAVVKMIAALTKKNFRCGSGFSPFSYFTKIAYRAFQNRIKEEKKIHEGAQKYQEHVYNMLMESGEIPFQKNTHHENKDSGYDDSHTFE